MRLIDADALQDIVYINKGNFNTVEGIREWIDKAPTVEVEFELKTENGITYPKALDQMTFTHRLSIEERQNIIAAYMLGANSNIRPQGDCENCDFRKFSDKFVGGVAEVMIKNDVATLEQLIEIFGKGNDNDG